MSQSFSIQLGKFLYKNAFPIYNLLYPVFKRKQDARELKLINSIVKPGFNVLDIGANIGFYTEVLSKLVGTNGCIYAFEPETTNFKHLQQNLQTNKNVKLINKAVSDKTGPIKIYLSKMLNVDHRTYPVDDYAEIIEINATTIDDYLTLNNCTHVDFIKMDIEGAEIEAIKGCENILRNNDVNLAIASYHLVNKERTSIELEKLFSRLGYRTETSFPEHLTTYAYKSKNSSENHV